MIAVYGALAVRNLTVGWGRLAGRSTMRYAAPSFECREYQSVVARASGIASNYW